MWQFQAMHVYSVPVTKQAYMLCRVTHNSFGYLARYISPLACNHNTNELTLCCVGRVSCTRNSATLLASMSESGDVVGASSTVCITGIYTSPRHSRQLLSLQRREEVRTKRRSRRGRLRGRGTQMQLLSLQSHCRNLMKVLMGQRKGRGKGKGM